MKPIIDMEYAIYDDDKILMIMIVYGEHDNTYGKRKL